MARFLINCKECNLTYAVHPQNKGTIITMAGGDGIVTNTELSQNPICPNCGKKAEWVVLMG